MACSVNVRWLKNKHSENRKRENASNEKDENEKRKSDESGKIVSEFAFVSKSEKGTVGEMCSRWYLR